MGGTVSQVGTRIFVAGSASGIDSAALIDAAVQQRTIRADRLQVQIDDNTATIGAYQELENLASSLESSLQSLVGNPGFFDENETVFDGKTGTVTTSDGSDFTGIANIGIENTAVKGTYDIEVTQLAQVQRATSDSITDQDADLGYAERFFLGLDGGTAQRVDIVATDSLAEIATKINAQTAGSGVEASIVKVSETDYQLVLSGNETNKEMQVSGIGGGIDVLQALGVIDGSQNFLNELQSAQGSTIEFNGVTVSRDDNNYDDLAVGISLDIKSAAPGTIISLEVGDDTTGVKDAILNFVDTYNTLRDFVVQNQQISSSGAVSEDALLFGDNLLDGVANTLSQILAENIGSGANIVTIRDLGLSIGNNNKIEVFDELRLDNAILNNYDEVSVAFGAGFTSNNANFTLLSSTSESASIIDKPLGIKTDGAGNITEVQVDGRIDLFDFSGSSFTGKAGTIYEGLTLAYSGSSTSESVTFTFSQGLADRVINSLATYTEPPSGLLVQERASLQSANQDKAADAQEIIDSAEAFRIREIERYADFEAKISSLNLLLDQIRAILGNDDDN